MGARAKSFKARIQDFEAEDVRAFYDNSMLRVWHLQGKARTFRIVRVQQIIKTEGEDTEKRAVVRLQNSQGEELPLPLELNPTNRDTIIGIYGSKKSNWVGKLITLYPTQCEAFGKMQECIRIRPFDPSQRQGDGVRTNRQGAHVLPNRPAPPKPEPAPAPADESSGLELDLGDDKDDGSDVFERNQYADVTSDTSEPPPGALATDIIR